MIDRNLLRDAAFAILLGLPTLALARPQSETPQPAAATQPHVEQAALADQRPEESRFNPTADS